MSRGKLPDKGGGEIGNSVDISTGEREEKMREREMRSCGGGKPRSERREETSGRREWCVEGAMD